VGARLSERHRTASDQGTSVDHAADESLADLRRRRSLVVFVVSLINVRHHLEPTVIPAQAHYRTRLRPLDTGHHSP